MAIVVVAIGVAVLLNHVVVEVKTTIRWLCAAIFLALALNPLVELIERARVRGRIAAALAGDPRRLRRSSSPPSSSCPRGDPADRPRGRAPRLAAADLRQGLRALGQQQPTSSASSTTSTTSPACSRSEASQLPSQARRRRRRARRRSRSGSSTTSSRRSSSSRSTFFLLLDGRCAVRRDHGPDPDAAARAGRAGSATRIAGDRQARTSRVNLLLAVLAGVFTWLALELLGVDLAVPLAVLVGIPRPRAADRVHGRRAAGRGRRRRCTASPARC